MFIKLSILAVFLIVSYSIVPTGYYKIKSKLSKIPKMRVNSQNSDDKVIFLTFDDGPDKRFTNQLLDLLSKYNIKASFFVVAKFAENNVEVIERMKKEGHLIGFHSLEHKNALCHSSKYTRNDFEFSQNIFENLGIKIKYFRPPWGHFNIQTLVCTKQFGFKIALWNVMAEDWKGDTTGQEIATKLIKRTKNRDVICLHDGRGTNEAPSRTIEALESVLPIWISQGYRFARINECYK